MMNSETLENQIDNEEIQYNIEQCYNGIRGLKKANVQVELQDWQVSEIEKCIDDPIYFIETYGKILHVDDGIIPFKPFEYQKKIVKNVLSNRFTINMLPRQYGKCHRGNTKYKVRNKTTGEIMTVTAEQFHQTISKPTLLPEPIEVS